MVLPTYDHYKGEAGIAAFTALLAAMMHELYDRGARIDPKGMHELLEAACDAVVNASYHGNNDDPSKKVEVRIWFGRTMMLMGFRDQGDFYSKESTEWKVKTRQSIEPDPNDGHEHRNCGMETIYMMEIVHVVTAQNALFFAHTVAKENAQSATPP